LGGCHDLGGGKLEEGGAGQCARQSCRKCKRKKCTCRKSLLAVWVGGGGHALEGGNGAAKEGARDAEGVGGGGEGGGREREREERDASESSTLEGKSERASVEGGRYLHY
jgi:hypothetical protein